MEKKEIKFFKSFKKYNYFPKYYEELIKVLNQKSISRDEDLNDIDVSNLTKLVPFSKFEFFKRNNFYVDEWNVSKIKDFGSLFFECFEFNSDLSNWDTSNAEFLEQMFSKSLKFNQPVLNFDFRNARYFPLFFNKCESFNQEVYSFKFNHYVFDLNSFFSLCYNFNQDVSMWDVSNVQNFSSMFFGARSFKQDLSSWNVENAKNWKDIFRGSLMENYPELMPEKFRSSISFK